MGSPEPDETPTPPATPPERADWLVGAEEGLAAEMERNAGGEIQRPTLLRPAGPPAGEDAPPPAPKPVRRFGAVLPGAETGSDFVQGPAMTWDPGPRSVPAVQRAAPAKPARRPAADGREFPADDIAERSAARTAEIEGALHDSLEGPRPHQPVSPESFHEVAPALPWWFEAASQLRTDRRVQVLAGIVALLVAAVVFWPRGPQGASVSGLRKHAQHYDGEQVKVSGRVGQVFPVGGGYAFYLLQGGDTLVVFTRTRKPVERQHVSVSGTMSNGSLDGQPTLALFEETGGR